MLKYLKQNWQSILKIGRKKDNHHLDNQRISLLNAIALISIITSLLIFLLYVVLGFNNQYIALSLIPIGCSVLLFNKKYKINTAKDFAFYGFSIIILLWSLYTRRTSTILLLMVVSCSSAFIYRQKITVFFRIFTCFIFYLIYIFYDNFYIFIADETINYPLLNVLMSLITTGLLLFVIMISVDLIKHTSKILSDKIIELNHFNDKQIIIKEEIKTNNKELEIFNSMLDVMVKKSLKELQSYQNAIDDNLYSIVTSLDGTILSINQPYLSLVQYTEEELIGEKFSILNSDYHTNSFFQEIKKTVQSGKLWRGETKNKAKDGGHFWISSTILPVLNENKEIIKFFTISINITDKKIAEEEQKIAYENLLKSNNRLSLVLENQSDLIVISNKAGMRKYVNIAYCDFFGKTKDDFIGTNYKTQEPDRATPIYLNLIDTLSFKNPKITFLEVIENKMNEKRWIVWNELATFNSNKEISEIFSFGHDITNLKQIEFQNANFIAQFEEIAFKTSHKFRGPLGNIMGIINLIDENDISQDEIKKIINFIKEDIVKLDLTSKDLSTFINNYQTNKNILKNKNQGNLDIEQAKSKHLNWKYKIRNFIDGSSSLTYNQATSSNHSELGKWYFNEGKVKYGHLKVIQKFEKEQEVLHNYVIEILDLKANNDLENAELVYQKLLSSSDKIIHFLEEAEEYLSRT